MEVCIFRAVSKVICPHSQNNRLLLFFHEGSSYNGAGSGGRIAVLLTNPLIYQGIISSIGGRSHRSSPAHGSPGTVYVETTIGDDVHRFLQVDNANDQNTALQVLLAEDGITIYNFDEIRLVRWGVLAAKQASSTLI